MIRLYAPCDFISSLPVVGSMILLNDNQHHYICNVMRLGQGDEFYLFNEIIGQWRVKIASRQKKHCSCEFVFQERPPLTNQATADTQIHLFFSPLKPAQTHMVIEKGTELGVTHFHPMRCARSNFHSFHIDKLYKIAMEATEQSERLDCPAILPLSNLNQSIDQWDAPQAPLIAALEREDNLPSLKTTLENKNFHKIGFIVGPEGGFDLKEKDFLKNHPAISSVHLGPRILRAETAIIGLIATYQTLCAD